MLSALEQEMHRLIQTYGYPRVLSEVYRQVPDHPVASSPARATDPPTSHRAAKRNLDVSRFSARSRPAKLLAVFALDPRTDHEATARVVGTSAVPSVWDGCRRRCSDLRAAGYLADTGRRRRNTGSEEDSVVWGVTLSGKRALEALDRTGWTKPPGGSR